MAALSFSASSFALGQRLTSAQRASVAPARAPMEVSAGQSLIGEVVSDAMSKSRTVLVKRQIAHPVYQKRITLSKKYLVHDEEEMCNKGDVVKIVACRPMSARKRFAVSEIVKKAFVQADAPLPSETQ